MIPGASDSATLRAARSALDRGLAGLLGHAPPLTATVTAGGAVLVITHKNTPPLPTLRLGLQHIGRDGYIIRTLKLHGHATIVVAERDDVGTLCGAVRYLRRLQTRQPVAHLNLASNPKIRCRILDSWNNLNGTVERGDAGDPICKWDEPPESLAPRSTDFARAPRSA